MSLIVYIILLTVLAGLMASVVYGLWWALQRGQLTNFEKGATCIFDDEEPVGFRTDAFPEKARKA